MRHIHNFRRVEIVEDGGTPKKKILWFPFVCWEDEKFHQQRRFEKDDPPEAKTCPACRLIDYFEGRSDLENDHIIFEFKGSGRGDKREIALIDFLGHGGGKGFQDNFLAKQEYLIPIIEIDDPTAVKLAPEKWSLGKALDKRIKNDQQIYGEDEHPSLKPIGYTFEYDDEAQKYGVGRLDGFKPSEEIVELWEGEPPDAEPYYRPGNPKTLIEAVRAGSRVDDLPIDDIFGPALDSWDRDDEEDPALVFPPADADEAQEKEAKPQKKPPKKPPSKSAPSKATKSSSDKPNGKTKPKKAVKAKPEPEPVESEIVVYECPECGGDWPEDDLKCPKCGAESADDDEGDSLPFEQ